MRGRLPMLMWVGVLWAGGTRADIHYVSTNSPSPAIPHTNWQTAAHTIQEAVDFSTAGDLVLVDRGLYDRGGAATGRISNRVHIAKNIQLRSVYGPAETVIRGGPSPSTGGLGTNACRGIYVQAPAPDLVIDGFTIEDGYTFDTNSTSTEVFGGGVLMFDGELSNCVIRNCTSLGSGGGVYGGRMYNCLVEGNRSLSGEAGGAFLFDNGGPVLQNSVVVSNTASGIGGVFMMSFGLDGHVRNSTIVLNVSTQTVGGLRYNPVTTTGRIVNSIIYFNQGPLGQNLSGTQMKFSHTCTVPAPSGPGNTNNFLDNPQIYTPLAGFDGRLRATSPCIDAGTNVPEIVGTRDLDGQPRVDGIVDIGADEASLSLLRVVRQTGQTELTWRVPPDGEFLFQESTAVTSGWTDVGATFVTGTTVAVTYGSVATPTRFSRLLWRTP